MDKEARRLIERRLSRLAAEIDEAHTMLERVCRNIDDVAESLFSEEEVAGYCEDGCMTLLLVGDIGHQNDGAPGCVWCEACCAGQVPVGPLKRQKPLKLKVVT